MKELQIRTDRIFTGEKWLQNQVVTIRDGKIHSVQPETAPLAGNIKNYPGCLLAPAFIDIQIYGAAERLVAVYPEPASLQLLYDYCRAGGAPLCLPTLATNSVEVFKKGIDAVRKYWSEGGRGIYGLHLEGPWINTAKKGAHIAGFIHAPTMEEVKALLDYGKNVVKMITLAPEICSGEVIRYLLQNNIIVSAGHSNASFEEAMAAFDNGIPTATHLYNAMSPLQHRAPGLVGALFQHDKACCSIIPDGHHVDYAAVKIAKKQMGERLFVITDAVTETTEGGYRHQRAGDKYECNGTLSGSALTMHKAFVNLVRHAGIEAGEALRMCGLYPARILKQDHLFGKIAPGYAAQLIVLNQQLELVDVISGETAA
jgi:N-acetylglucosamine-6-phosphate deacetylase